MATTEKTGNQSLDRAIHMLKLVGEAGARGLSAREIGEGTGLSAPTVYRNLQALEAHGLISSQKRRYVIGRGALFLAASAFEADPLHKVAIAPLRRVAQATGCSVSLLIRHGTQAMLAARAEGTFNMRMIFPGVGSCVSLGIGPGGICLLTALDDAALREVIAANRSELVGKYFFAEIEIYEAVEAARKMGVARDPGTIYPDVFGLAVPVFNTNGKVIASVGISAILERATGDREKRIIDLLKTAAAEIGERANPVIEHTDAIYT